MASHPGPKPKPFAFPFGEAQRLRDAAEALADDIGVLVEQSRCAIDYASMGFQGKTQAQVEAGFNDLVFDLVAVRRELDAQADSVAHALRRAATASAERDARIAAWHRDLRSYQQEQAAGAGR